jgi:chemotaxis regulatin CheY-phosphate phosphatase CheZ
MPYQRRAEAILAHWREIERALDHVETGTAEADYLHGLAAELRDEYQALVEAAIEGEHPQPPPFPEASVS